MEYNQHHKWKFIPEGIEKKLTFKEKQMIDDILVKNNEIIYERMCDYLDYFEKKETASNYEEQKMIGNSIDDIMTELKVAFKKIYSLTKHNGLECCRRDILVASRNAISDAFENFLDTISTLYWMDEDDINRLRRVYMSLFWIPLEDGKEQMDRVLETRIRNYGVECYRIKQLNSNGF